MHKFKKRGLTLKPGLAIARGKSKGKTESFDKDERPLKHMIMLVVSFPKIESAADTASLTWTPRGFYPSNPMLML